MYLKDIDPTQDMNFEITSVTADSRAVRRNGLFAALSPALPGNRSDGTVYINDAITNGATVILAPYKVDVPDNVVLIVDDNTRRRFASIAAQFYAQQPKTTVAVTGTNGKTSTVSFVKQFWELLGYEAASLGTLGIQTNKTNKAIGMTTPDAAALHAMLADLAAAGVDHLAMEASSHGLDQYRLHGVKLAAAAFTNLTRDHLDYHGTMENYLDAKMKLFTELLVEDGAAVLNADTPEFEKMADICRARKIRIIDYGRRAETIKLNDVTPTNNAQRLSLTIFGKDYTIDLPLMGLFQTWNALAALGLVLANEKDAEKIVPLLGKLKSVRGRIEYVGQTAKGAPVFVDYAHTPNALEIILGALRHHTQNKLWVVFGCGGNRDKGKRAIMGKIASTLADKVIVTDDNPRYENSIDIRGEIMANAQDALEIADREEAIRYAVQHLDEGDVLVIAGKGHELGQIIGDEVRPFDDFAVATSALKKAS